MTGPDDDRRRAIEALRNAPKLPTGPVEPQRHPMRWAIIVAAVLVLAVPLVAYLGDRIAKVEWCQINDSCKPQDSLGDVARKLREAKGLKN